MVTPKRGKHGGTGFGARMRLDVDTPILGDASSPICGAVALFRLGALPYFETHEDQWFAEAWPQHFRSAHLKINAMGSFARIRCSVYRLHGFALEERTCHFLLFPSRPFPDRLPIGRSQRNVAG